MFHNYFFPFTEGFRHADANDFDSVEAMAGHDVCAVMFELIQGEGGVLPLDREFVQKVSDLCAKRDWLLLIDEVQTGVGRTGSLFAFQQYGIQPDAVSFAKGIAGGLPFGGVMAGEKCRQCLHHRHPRHHLRGQPHLRGRSLLRAGPDGRRHVPVRPGEGGISPQPH